MLCRTGLLRGLIAAITVIVLGLVGFGGEARADVGSSDQFTPRTWAPGGEQPQTARARNGRRPVTNSTRLEEFGVPRRAATNNRVVERRKTQKRARVAALPRRTATDAPTPRRTVQRPATRRAAPVRLAALGGGVPWVGRSGPSLTGGGIAWRASSGCLAGNLRSIVSVLASNHGSLTVNSTCRNAGHNRRVGGARRSWHLSGNAVDFRIHGANIGRVYAYLRGSVGGLKHYGGGRFHIDNGPRRTF